MGEPKAATLEPAVPAWPFAFRFSRGFWGFLGTDPKNPLFCCGLWFAHRRSFRWRPRSPLANGKGARVFQPVDDHGQDRNVRAPGSGVFGDRPQKSQWSRHLPANSRRGRRSPAVRIGRARGARPRERRGRGRQCRALSGLPGRTAPGRRYTPRGQPGLHTGAGGWRGG
jgi:hypothetical protein